MTGSHLHPDVVGTGFTVLDRIYADGAFTAEALGGSCGNVLVSLAMLDRCVTPVLALGCDEVGRRLVDEFETAGADVSLISLSEHRRSPVLAQRLDTATGEHSFSFTCVETCTSYPEYVPIGSDEVFLAGQAIGSCRVFYADRVSDEIVEAMESARSAGAVVYFEPSAIDDDELFERAVRTTTILKYSSERLGRRVEGMRYADAIISIVTHGEAGLEMRQGGEARWCAAVPVEHVTDTCGSGDMVSVGVIDWVLARSATPRPFSLADIAEGVVAGQRLAAENCAYAGARGVFHEKGATHARRVLSES